MADNTQVEFKKEGDLAFPVEQGDDNSPASPTEKTTDDQTPSPEEDKKGTEKETGAEEDDKLMNHPRWKEREEDWKKRFNTQEQRHLSEIEKVRQEFLQKNSPESVEIPPWFAGDEEAWKQFNSWQESRLSKVKEDTLKDFQTRTKADQDAIDEATTFMNTEMVNLEKDKTINPDGLKIDRNKLLKFVLDNELVDTKGRWNYKAGFLLLKNELASSKNRNTDERKKLAGATTSESGGGSNSPSFTTSEDFKKPGARPW